MSKLISQTIDARAVIQEVERPAAGAILTFAGTVRNHHLRREVTGIEYHAYEEMAVKELDHIEAAAKEKWPDIEIEIVHRIGCLEVGEASVLIAVGAAHRKEGFEALRYAIETIKEDVPIWKKEMYTDGHAWIEGS